MTQNEMVIDYLTDVGCITQFEAFYDLGIMRLASRMSDIKGQIKFGKITKLVRNRHGVKTPVAEYYIPMSGVQIKEKIKKEHVGTRKVAKEYGLSKITFLLKLRGSFSLNETGKLLKIINNIAIGSDEYHV